MNDKNFNTFTQGSLRPITSLDTGRYDRRSLASPQSTIIAAGYPLVQGPIPQYLPPQWSPYTHPEGQLYFHRYSALKITTDAYLYYPETLAKVLFWAKHIEALFEESSIPFSHSIELYILIEEAGCAYYFIDHASKSQFWLESLENDQLGIPDVDSPSHLDLYLEYLYWAHIEHFPMHFGGLPVQVVDSLLPVFTHGLTDQITSQTSTFFYTQTECEKFIKVLKLARQNSADGNQVCVVARLWRSVCDNRFQTHYGQETTRLGRNQAILFDSPLPSRISTVARWLTFNASDVYLTKLNDLFVDHLVYFSQWQPFIRRSLKGWSRSFWTAFAILLLHVFMFQINCSPMLAIASAFLSSTSLLLSAILVHRYERLESDDACANDVYEHLEAVHSSRYDFQFLALSYALPSALQLWALLCLGANAIIVLSGVLGVRWAAAAGLSVVFVFLSVLRITSQTSWNIAIPNMLRRSNKDEESMV